MTAFVFWPRFEIHVVYHVTIIHVMLYPPAQDTVPQAVLTGVASILVYGHVHGARFCQVEGVEARGAHGTPGTMVKL